MRQFSSNGHRNYIFHSENLQQEETTTAMEGRSNKGAQATLANNSDNTKSKQDVSNGRSRFPSTSRGGGNGSNWGVSAAAVSTRPRSGRQFKTFLPPSNSDAQRRHSSGGAAKSGSYNQPSALSVMMDDEIEVGSVLKPGNKKSNYNHLLNFDYGPQRGLNHRHPYAQQQQSGGGKNHSKAGHNASSKSKYTKEDFLQANCQFVVKAEGDYLIHMSDPNILVKWDLIEEVILKTNEDPSCPICLCPPQAAKITPCGHVYCWSCLLHYLALSDDSSRKCPICEESVSKEDVKSVVFRPFPVHSVGDVLEMRLMRRHRNSMFALHADKYDVEITQRHPNMDQEYNSYSKLLLATTSQVIERVLDRERQQLLESYELEKDEPEVCFILEALDLLNKRHSELKSHGEALAVMPPLLENMTLDRPRHLSSSGSSTDGCGPLLTRQKKEDFHFYQSSDGQLLYLHVFNAKMLECQFGDLKDAPLVIRGKVVEKESVTLTKELLSKLRYLQHLSLHCNVEFVELEIDSVTFDDEVVEQFQAQLDDRKRKRDKRARQEKKREKMIRIEENKLMGKYPDPKYRIESNFHFPDIEKSQEPLRRSTESLHSNEDDEDSAPSFAKVIRQGRTQPLMRSESFPAPSWAAMTGTSAASAPPSWPYQGGNRPAARLNHDEDDDDDHQESYVPERPSISFDLTNSVVVVKKGGNKKKKGGKKNMILLSTAPRPTI